MFEGRDQEFAEFNFARIASQIIEQGRRVRADLGVAGEQSHIGIEMCRCWIVVSRCEVQVTADRATFTANHQSYF